MKSIQKSATRLAKDAPQEEPASTADLRNPELSEEVACCLAEIDSALQKTEDEREKAELEFSVTRDKVWKGILSREGAEDILRVWEAKYAHLGLKTGWCCGMPAIMDE